VPEALFTRVLQIALVVRDLDASLQVYEERYGLGPWQVHDVDPAADWDEPSHGRRAAQPFRVARTELDGIGWELIQPLSDHGTYAAFLRTHGEGVHHVSFDTPLPLDRVVAAAPGVLQGGSVHGLTHVYLDTAAELGVIVEVYDH
jgi:catechol 2,3-dioxygenase-like lactoylglutathione lyase family enzyme